MSNIDKEIRWSDTNCGKIFNIIRNNKYLSFVILTTVVSIIICSALVFEIFADRDNKTGFIPVFMIYIIATIMADIFVPLYLLLDQDHKFELTIKKIFGIETNAKNVTKYYFTKITISNIIALLFVKYAENYMYWALIFACITLLSTILYGILMGLKWMCVQCCYECLIGCKNSMCHRYIEEEIVDDSNNNRVELHDDIV